MHNNISSGAWVRVVFASANKYEIEEPRLGLRRANIMGDLLW